VRICKRIQAYRRTRMEGNLISAENGYRVDLYGM
jgi:hypothetical protein